MQDSGDTYVFYRQGTCQQETVGAAAQTKGCKARQHNIWCLRFFTLTLVYFPIPVSELKNSSTYLSVFISLVSLLYSSSHATLSVLKIPEYWKHLFVRKSKVPGGTLTDGIQTLPWRERKYICPEKQLKRIQESGWVTNVDVSYKIKKRQGQGERHNDMKV